MLQRAHAFLCDSQNFMVPVNTKQIKMIVQTNVRFKSNESLEHPKKYHRQIKGYLKSSVLEEKKNNLNCHFAELTIKKTIL